MSEPDLSPVAVVGALVTLLLGPQFAAAVGAYSVILMGWCGGVMVGVWRMPPAPRLHLLAFVLVTLVGTLGVTVPLAELASDFMRKAAPWAITGESRGLLFPVAFVLPAVGHSWLPLAAWAWGLVRGRFERKAADQADGGKP